MSHNLTLHKLPFWLVTLVGWWNSGALTLVIRHHSLIPLLIQYHSLIIDNTLKITGRVLVAMLQNGYFLQI